MHLTKPTSNLSEKSNQMNKFIKDFAEAFDAVKNHSIYLGEISFCKNQQQQISLSDFRQYVLSEKTFLDDLKKDVTALKISPKAAKVAAQVLNILEGYRHIEPVRNIPIDLSTIASEKTSFCFLELDLRDNELWLIGYKKNGSQKKVCKLHTFYNDSIPHNFTRALVENLIAEDKSEGDKKNPAKILQRIGFEGPLRKVFVEKSTKNQVVLRCKKIDISKIQDESLRDALFEQLRVLKNRQMIKI